MQREASFNDLVTATFAQVSANRTAALVYLAISVPLSALATYLSLEGAAVFDLGFDTMTVAGLSAGFVQVATAIAGLVMQYWLTCAMLRGGLEVRFDRLLPFLGIYLLGSIGIGLGLVLLIIPGLIFMTRWALILPIVVTGEVPAMDSFGDSWERTASSAWPLFFAFVLLVIGAAALSWFIGSLASAIPGSGTIPVAIFQALIAEMGSIAMIAFAVGAYRLLTDNTRELEEVFA
ncbi:MAG TPA: hypothetical protein VK913_04720 [Erythrobacter sp.]|nr:hypothetical protein [Erythrobacter sp.]